jgi:hypothetical protein
MHITRATVHLNVHVPHRMRVPDLWLVVELNELNSLTHLFF